MHFEKNEIRMFETTARAKAKAKATANRTKLVILTLLEVLLNINEIRCFSS